MIMAISQYYSASHCSAAQSSSENHTSTIYYHPEQNSNYFVELTFLSVRLTYEINILGHLTQSTIPSHYIKDHQNTLRDLQVSIRPNMQSILTKTAINIIKIAARLNLGPMGQQLKSILQTFQEKIIELNSEDPNRCQVLDLSGLGLDLLPAQMSFFTNIRKLNLSNNKLALIPPHLKLLINLEEVDLRNNPILGKPKLGSNDHKVTILTSLPKRSKSQCAQRPLSFDYE